MYTEILIYPLRIKMHIIIKDGVKGVNYKQKLKTTIIIFFEGGTILVGCQVYNQQIIF